MSFPPQTKGLLGDIVGYANAGGFRISAASTDGFIVIEIMNDEVGRRWIELKPDAAERFARGLLDLVEDARKG